MTKCLLFQYSIAAGKHTDYFELSSFFQVNQLSLLYLGKTKFILDSMTIFSLLSRNELTYFLIKTDSVLLYDEMYLECSLFYITYMDCVEGLEDYGAIGKTRFIANNALVFRVRGLANEWKQCKGYFLSSRPTKGDSLQYLTRQTIDKLSSIDLKV